MSAEAQYRASVLRPGDRMSATPPLSVRLDAVIASVPAARHQLGRWLSRARLPRDACDDLALVVTELVTNAVEASPGPNAAIELRAEVQAAEAVVITVTDRGRGFALLDSPSVPTDDAIRGRGLPIVNALMDDLDVRHVEGCTQVTAVRLLR